MPKLQNKPIDATDIDRYISTEDDFNFEIEVFNAFKTLGIYATHGGTYDDPVTSKPRQYDIRALLRRDIFNIRMAVECKNLKDFFPLVVSRLPREFAESYYEVLFTHASKDKGLYTPGFDFLNNKTARLRNPNFLYNLNQPVGKSTIQIGIPEKKETEFHANDVEVYEKWAQAVASAHDLLSEAKTDFEHSNEKKQAVTVVLPILVVPDNVLWCIDYNKEGKRLGPPSQVSYCSIFIGADISSTIGLSYNISHLEVYTKTYLTSWLSHLMKPEVVSEYFPIERINAVLKES